MLASLFHEDSGDSDATPGAGAPAAAPPSGPPADASPPGAADAGAASGAAFPARDSSDATADGSDGRDTSAGAAAPSLSSRVAEDALADVAACLALRDLAAWHAAGGCPDAAWRPHVPAPTLFRLRRPPPSRATWRRRWAAVVGARRLDFDIVPGVFKLKGFTLDRKGRCASDGTVEIAKSIVCVGSIVHVRDGPGGAVLRGEGHGNLGAHVRPGAGKRLWALSWKENLEGGTGSYSYVGQLRTRPDGILEWRGEFSWFGGGRGRFEFTLERDASAPLTAPIHYMPPPRGVRLLLA